MICISKAYFNHDDVVEGIFSHIFHILFICIYVYEFAWNLHINSHKRKFCHDFLDFALTEPAEFFLMFLISVTLVLHILTVHDLLMGQPTTKVAICGEIPAEWARTMHSLVRASRTTATAESLLQPVRVFHGGRFIFKSQLRSDCSLNLSRGNSPTSGWGRSPRVS